MLTPQNLRNIKVGIFHPKHFQTRQQVKVKVSLCFNYAPCHEGVLWEWRCSSRHSWPRH